MVNSQLSRSHTRRVRQILLLLRTYLKSAPTAAGWLAGQIVQGTGLGIVGDLVVGIAGAFIASLIFPQLGIHFGSGIVSEIVEAAIGAILLLLIIMLVRGQSQWGGS